MSDHNYIISRTPELSDDEAAFIRKIVDRVLVVGRRSYSPWSADSETRNMPAEAQFEMLDGCVYLSMHSVMRERRKRERLECFKRDEEWRRVDVGLTELIAAEDSACTDCLAPHGLEHRDGCPWITRVPA